MKKFLLIIVISFASLATGQTKNEKVKQLLIEMKTTSNFEKMLDYLTTNAQKTYPDITEDFWIQFKKEADTDILIEKIIPVYEKHFTTKEIEDLIAFYKTPSGQSLIEKQSILFQEVNKIGEEWGIALAQKIMNKAGVTPSYGNPPTPKK